LPTRLFRRLFAGVRALGDQRLQSTYQTTFWFDFGTPTAVVEEAVLAVRWRLPSRRVTGVEWWLSRMWTNDVRVDFHRDRDEQRALRTGALRFPLYSSVLFLNRVRGGALVVTAQPPDPANPACVPLPLDGDLAAPRANRLVWFDGRLTHGVLDTANKIPRGGGRSPGDLRLAVVMNWWDARPLGVPIFTDRRVYAPLRTRNGRRASTSTEPTRRRAT
jgi:hypothetical protein